jgi:hypothetical protein
MPSKLLDAVVNLEPPSLGKRLDDLETCIRLQMKQISQLRFDLVELREWVILDKAGRPENRTKTGGKV